MSSVTSVPAMLQVRAWLATVRSLAHIRHENVLLYMGAAVDPPILENSILFPRPRNNKYSYFNLMSR